ncbi:tRNA (5-methylaminomethyl-2-thiouridylate)-methyltransferase [Malonomonas rubra DSM 5091]|uniref:tRNA-specific 2-thiouridylase MnmA n=1 Tax=Malonomonas rubra DSM 5091 TaxID=1122189 RepID=A0A1M6B4W6_MALRU|nr:tRNA 2-thiouridine(34) synthase MnmA [Malonomonas rubra]SHI43493.1 tRNA (5-methylaminomethyl-2-thiouridylate)-methyltransferase [Malonomonas rubra DSM 5091]
MNRKPVVVAMSGGVDSSVTAALLQEQGHEVIGVTMQLWDQSSGVSCCSADNVRDARRVAEQLDIPFHVVHFEDEFQSQVIKTFCDEYFIGRTPNPCVVCNQILKFDLLLRKARELGAEKMATGHYANIVEKDGRYLLQKGVDRHKDQSYFLFALTQEQLSCSLFPLGSMSKDDVRSHAERFDLQVAQKAESQDICFIPDGDYVNFLEEQRGHGQLDGDIVHVSGKVLGKHKGIYRYTVGQRKGLGIGWTAPLFVVGINAENKQVIVGEREHLSRKELEIDGCNWSIEEPQETFKTYCRIRYRHHEVPATVQPLTNRQARIVFEDAQKGITPGQAAVFYADDLVLGGGWIK